MSEADDGVRTFAQRPPTDFPTPSTLPGHIPCARDAYRSGLSSEESTGIALTIESAMLLTVPVANWLLERSGFGEVEECGYALKDEIPHWTRDGRS